MFKYIKSFFLALNANVHPGDIGHAISLGLLLALVPKANLLWLFLFLLTIFIRVNKGAFFLSLILLSFAVPYADVFLDRLGFMLLSLPFLNTFYTVLYQTPFIGLTKFNNTIVAGSLVMGIIAYVPAYVLFRSIVVQYRKKLQPMIAGSKFAKVFVQLPLIRQIINAPDIRGFEK
jgi:uncharacterized protein (TIGR03546 family)